MTLCIWNPEDILHTLQVLRFFVQQLFIENTVQCLKYRFSTLLFGQIRYILFTPPTATDIAMSDKLYIIHYSSEWRIDSTLKFSTSEKYLVDIALIIIWSTIYVTTDTLPQIRDRILLIGLVLSGDQIWSKFIPSHYMLRFVGPQDCILNTKGTERWKRATLPHDFSFCVSVSQLNAKFSDRYVTT